MNANELLGVIDGCVARAGAAPGYGLGPVAGPSSSLWSAVSEVVSACASGSGMDEACEQLDDLLLEGGHVVPAFECEGATVGVLVGRAVGLRLRIYGRVSGPGGGSGIESLNGLLAEYYGLKARISRLMRSPNRASKSRHERPSGLGLASALPEGPVGIADDAARLYLDL